MDVFLADGSDFLPGISIDCIIFGFHDGVLKVLLNRFNLNKNWMLPGGFILQDEDIDNAAYRLLESRTGLKKVFLRQFYVFGNCDRNNRETNLMLLQKYRPDEEIDNNHWLLKRFITIGYYALVDFTKAKIKAGKGEEISWFDINNMPELHLDHNKIISKGIEAIRIQIRSIPIGLELLPTQFTLPELRIIYETILEKTLDRRNFQRKIMSYGYIIKLNEKRKGGAHKAPDYYSFDKEKYINATIHGIRTDW